MRQTGKAGVNLRRKVVKKETGLGKPDAKEGGKETATGGDTHLGLVLGIDPGSSESGYALVNPQYGCWEAGKISNIVLLDRLGLGSMQPSAVCVESIQSYGMPVGRSVFETCYQIGAILEVCRQACIPTYLYPRQEYARAICGSVKVTDAILRQALLLRFGGDGKNEPLAALRGNTDKRSAFAVACYHLDCERVRR